MLGRVNYDRQSSQTSVDLSYANVIGQVRITWAVMSDNGHWSRQSEVGGQVRLFLLVESH